MKISKIFLFQQSNISGTGKHMELNVITIFISDVQIIYNIKRNYQRRNDEANFK